MSGGSSKDNPYYEKYPPISKEKRIVYKKKKRKKPIKLPKREPTRPIKVIPLPPFRNLIAGRNKSKLLWYKCDNCDCYFPVRTSRMKKSEFGFCGKECQAAFQSQRLQGHVIPQETRDKISDTKKGIRQKNKPKNNEGRPRKNPGTEPRNPVWYQKAMELAEAYRNSGEWRRKSKEIRERDNDTCQGCGFNRDEVPLLGVHHVKKLAEWIYEGNDPSEYPDNLLVTLCHNCHSPTEMQKDEYKWPISSRGDKTKPGFPL